jgi:hypothetical protein
MGGVSGCQLTTHSDAQVSNVDDNQAIYSENYKDYGQYYVYLKTLSRQDLVAEIDKQKNILAAGEKNTRMNIILLYSLPNSPIYNAYTAKTVLNKYIQSNSVDLISRHNKAFVNLLKDQLNQQIKLFEKIQLMENNTQMNEDTLSEISKLEAEIADLLKKIDQLRNIEKAISSQGYH